MSFAVRPFQAGDEEGICALFDELRPAPGGDRLRRGWAWQFRDNPFQPDGGAEAASILVAVDNGWIGGSLLSFPVPLRAAGRETTAWVVTDYLVHPRLRGAGASLARAMTAQRKLLFGTPNPVSLPVWLALRCTDIGNPATRVHWIDPASRLCRVPALRPFAGLLGSAIARATEWASVRAGRGEGWTFEQVDAPGPEFDDFWESAGAGYDVAIARRSRWLAWRYLEHPDLRYRIVAARCSGRLRGYVVHRLREARGAWRGRIVDLFVARGDREAASRLAARAVADLRQAGADSVDCLASDEHVDAALRRSGFWAKRRDIRLVGSMRAPGVDASMLKPPARWFVAMGDGEVDLVA